MKPNVYLILFHSLDESQISHIVEIQLDKLSNRLAQQQLTLDVDDAAKKLLAREGYDPQFGARPLKRAIQEHLLDPLATKLLAGQFKPGDQIKAATNGEGFGIQKEIIVRSGGDKGGRFLDRINKLLRIPEILFIL